MRMFDAFVRLVTGSRNGIRGITLREEGSVHRCYVWDDSLWVAVKDVILLSVYERAGVELRQTSGTVIDAGAHVGLFSVRASLYARQVVAIEASNLNYPILQLNIARNRLDNVSPVHAALWPTQGIVTFLPGSHSHDGLILQKQTSGRVVEAITLQELVARYGHIALLKIDIEGAEFEVLMSASDDVLRGIDVIVAELDLAPDRDEHELRKRLERSGYEVTLLDPPILSTAESIRKIMKNWRALGGAIRLKLLVLIVYLVEPLLREIVRDGERVKRAGPRYLFAKRLSI